jgi:hypothetical protein
MRTLSILTLWLGYLLVSGAAAQEFASMTFSGKRGSEGKSTFVAGETIYAQARLRAAPERLPVTRRVTLSLKVFERVGGGESFVDYFDIGLSGELMQATALLLELAPEVDDCRSYRDPNLHFKTFGKRLDGPAAMCQILSRLSPGRHELVLRLEQDGVPLASGVLVIQGESFAGYAGMEARLKERFWPK